MTHRMDLNINKIDTSIPCITTLQPILSNTFHLRQKLTHFISQWVNINWIFIRLDSWRWMSYKKQEQFNLREKMGSNLVFARVRVAHVLSFPCCVFVFVCLRSVSFVPNVARQCLHCSFFIALSVSLTFIYSVWT